VKIEPKRKIQQFTYYKFASAGQLINTAWQINIRKCFGDFLFNDIGVFRLIRNKV